MKELIFDTLADTIKLIPFLFLTYLAMEWLEHHTGSLAERLVEKSGRWGPLFGAVIGAVPQCGFSAAGSSLYAGRVITIGTLFAIYLSTSDEMLPVMISQAAPAAVIGKILFCKTLIGFLAGFSVDILYQRHGLEHRPGGRERPREQRRDCCGGAIWRSALLHTLQVAFFLLLVTFGMHLLFREIGSERISLLFRDHGVFAVFAAGLVGMIPNCAASVMITQLYLSGALSFGAMLSGLLTGSGAGLLVLFRVNGNMKENAAIAVGLYLIGTLCGVLAGTAGLNYGSM